MTPEVLLYPAFALAAFWIIFASYDLYEEWKWEKDAISKGWNEYEGWPRP